MNPAELNNNTVLVLNRGWQAIHAMSPAKALSMIYAGVATALDIQGEDVMIPMKWDEWQKLELKDGDIFVNTVHAKIKVPRVIILAKYDKVPIRKPRLTSAAIRKRDKDTCQYCGKGSSKRKMNLDHVVPRAQGGATSWRNLVCSCIPCNSRKRDRTPHEAGMNLARLPQEPKALPASHFIQNHFGIPEWEPFIHKKN